MLPPPPTSTLFPYTTLFRSQVERLKAFKADRDAELVERRLQELRNAAEGKDNLLPSIHDALRDRDGRQEDRKSTRLNSSHITISYAVFCLKKKNRAAADDQD